MSVISDKLNIISNAKDDIKNAIESKGVAVGDVGIQEYAEKINGIESMPNISKGIIVRECDSNGFPTEVELVGMTEIPDYAFYSQSSSYLTLFSKELKKVIFTKNTTKIGQRAFCWCSKLELDELPSGLTDIPTYAFFNCLSLALTKLPSGLTTIGSYVFQNCSKLTLTELPNGLTTIGTYAFAGCTNLALTKLPNSLTTASDTAFQNCTNLALTELPSGLKSISNGLFDGCSKLAITEVPSNITSIGTSAFNKCTSLTSMYLPSSITRVTSRTFYGCSNIEEITYDGGNIDEVGSYAFYGCSKLNKLVFSNITQVPTLTNVNAFTNTPIKTGTGYVYVPDALITQFQSASNWSTYASQIKGVSEL